VKRRARQRAAAMERAKEIAGRNSQVATPQSAVPLALRQYNTVAVARLIAAGKRRGYVTYEDLNKILPASEVSADEIEAVFEAILDLGFEAREY
jgi:RNA polymerase primary sigma factor